MIDAIGQPGPLWFPGLAEKLAARFNGQTGAPANKIYCTADWLGLAEPGYGQGECFAIGDRFAILENLPNRRMSGLAILPARWREDDAVQVRFAFSLLDKVDGLTATLAPLVRAIVRLDAEPEFDISHSEPRLPYSIFLSLPPPSATAAVRLAESILHEAMHLQLSLIEAKQRLVANARQSAWSPWQLKERPAQGLLHGLYVFAVIFETLGRLEKVAPQLIDRQSNVDVVEKVRGHIRTRCRQIAYEVSALPDFTAALTPDGIRLRRRCLECVTSSVIDNLVSSR